MNGNKGFGPQNKTLEWQVIWGYYGLRVNVQGLECYPQSPKLFSSRRLPHTKSQYPWFLTFALHRNCRNQSEVIDHPCFFSLSIWFFFCICEQTIDLETQFSAKLIFGINSKIMLKRSIKLNCDCSFCGTIFVKDVCKDKYLSYRSHSDFSL